MGNLNNLCKLIKKRLCPHLHYFRYSLRTTLGKIFILFEYILPNHNKIWRLLNTKHILKEHWGECWKPQNRNGLPTLLVNLHDPLYCCVCCYQVFCTAKQYRNRITGSPAPSTCPRPTPTSHYYGQLVHLIRLHSICPEGIFSMLSLPNATKFSGSGKTAMLQKMMSHIN